MPKLNVVPAKPKKMPAKPKKKKYKFRVKPKKEFKESKRNPAPLPVTQKQGGGKKIIKSNATGFVKSRGTANFVMGGSDRQTGMVQRRGYRDARSGYGTPAHYYEFSNSGTGFQMGRNNERSLVPVSKHIMEFKDF